MKSYILISMKLLTKAILKKLPTIGSNEKNNKEHIAHVKLFGGSNWSWFISEFNPDTKECFGYVEGLENELGFFSLTELEKIRFKPFNLPVERDICFESTPIKELMNK